MALETEIPKRTHKLAFIKYVESDGGGVAYALMLSQWMQWVGGLEIDFLRKYLMNAI
jgi:hypothetical protein